MYVSHADVNKHAHGADGARAHTGGARMAGQQAAGGARLQARSRLHPYVIVAVGSAAGSAAGSDPRARIRALRALSVSLSRLRKRLRARLAWLRHTYRISTSASKVMGREARLADLAA